MSGVQETKSAAESDVNHGIIGGGSHSNGGGGGGGGGLVGIAAVQKAFRFLDGPADVLSASTTCRRWRELACAGSVWRAKAEREGILDKAAAFEVEVPRVAEGGSALDEETASMAFYARVFVLKVGGTVEGERARCRIRLTNTRRRCRPATADRAGVQNEGRGRAGTPRQTRA